MRLLTAYDIIRIWEIGSSQDSIDRAVTILAFTLPNRTIDEITAMSIGMRDDYLLAVRAHVFGPKLESTTECPECAQKLEFDFDLSQIRRHDNQKSDVNEFQVEQDGYKIRFRLPNSRDLQYIAKYKINHARRQLMYRCVLEAKKENKTKNVKRLPEKIEALITKKMSECDPQANIFFSLSCASCRHKWRMIFDISTYLWQEISVLALHLLQEVHVLARAYGWSEMDILAMSAARRRYYLEMVS